MTTPADFNPYEPPKVEPPAKSRAARRVVTVSLVQIAAMAWFATFLTTLPVPSDDSRKPRTWLGHASSVLAILSLTVAASLTLICIGGLFLRSLLRRREKQAKNKNR